MYAVAITPIALKEHGPYAVNDHVPILEHTGGYHRCIGAIGIVNELASKTNEMIVACLTCHSTDVMIYHAKPAKSLPR